MRAVVAIAEERQGAHKLSRCLRATGCVPPLSVASVSCDVKGMGDKWIIADISKPQI